MYTFTKEPTDRDCTHVRILVLDSSEETRERRSPEGKSTRDTRSEARSFLLKLTTLAR